MTTTTQIKERPVIFSAAMVRAILDGKKIMTRRVIKPQPILHDAEQYFFEWSKASDLLNWPEMLDRCPYGQPGDLLWVRETWQAMSPTNCAWSLYKPIEREGYRPDQWRVLYAADGGHPDYARFNPSIHMPRWASRITLRITDVRVERVQEISEADAEAEGVYDRDEGGDLINGSYAITNFARLWDSINGERPGCTWSDNPFCWVVAFEVVKP